MRKVEVNEGFFVTGMLFPLILPPTTPLWQAALGHQLRRGDGQGGVRRHRHELRQPGAGGPRLPVLRLPGVDVGRLVWSAVPPAAAVDGFSGATLLAQMRLDEHALRRRRPVMVDAFIGLEPGLDGRDLGAGLPDRRAGHRLHRRRLVAHHGRRRARHGGHGARLFNAIGSDTNPWFGVPFWWHMVLGGWAFATAFMATDPVTAPFTDAGKWVYGILIGAMIVLIRVVNPAYPESVMLVILFMNVMAPLIDHVFVRANIRRRQAAPAASRQETAMATKDSVRYTVLFAAAVCVVCALLVAGAAVALQPRQDGQRAPVHAEERAARGRPGRAGRRHAGAASCGASSTSASRCGWSTSPRASCCRPSASTPPATTSARARNDPRASRAAPANRAGIARLAELRARLFRQGPAGGGRADRARRRGPGHVGHDLRLRRAGARRQHRARPGLLRPEGNARSRRRDRQPELAGAVARPQGLRRAVAAALTVIKGSAGPAEQRPAPRRRPVRRHHHQQRDDAADAVLAVGRRLRPLAEALARRGRA